MPVIYFFAMVAMLGFGVNVLWMNSRRLVNRVFAGICFLCTLYFGFTLMARYYGNVYLTTHVYEGLPWVRLTWSTTAFMPLYLWTLFYVVSGRYQSTKELLLKLAPWAMLTAWLIVLAWTEFFIGSNNLPDRRTPGPGFWLFQIILVLVAVPLLIRSLMVLPKLTGIRKLEFKFFALTCSALSLFAILLPLLTFLPTPLRKLVTIPIVCYGISGWFIASRRVYESAQIFGALAARAVVFSAVGGAALWAINLSHSMESNVYSHVAIIAIFSLCGYFADEMLRRWLSLKPEQQLTSVRRRLLRIAEAENSPDMLLGGFQTILAEWAETSRVIILRSDGERYVGDEIALPRALLENAASFFEGWVTSASLVRGRVSESDLALMQTLKRARIEALVAANWRDSTPTLLIAIGARDNELPFTYPEVRRLQELAEVVDSCFTKAVYKLQARQAEQLATIGRASAALVHEMRNPMWTLRAFARTLQSRLDDAQFLTSFSQLVPREAERVHALAEQLLNASKPREYHFTDVDVHRLIEETLLLLKAKVDEHGVAIRLELFATISSVLGDRNALRQVLINLIENALQALATIPGPRNLSVRTRDEHSRVIVEVLDNGPGIPVEIRRKLFTEFATSGKDGGLGLGLAICAGIVRDHHGSISAPEGSGSGALFRLELPFSVSVKQIRENNLSEARANI